MPKESSSKVGNVPVRKGYQPRTRTQNGGNADALQSTTAKCSGYDKGHAEGSFTAFSGAGKMGIRINTK